MNTYQVKTIQKMLNFYLLEVCKTLAKNAWEARTYTSEEILTILNADAPKDEESDLPVALRTSKVEVADASGSMPANDDGTESSDEEEIDVDKTPSKESSTSEVKAATAESSETEVMESTSKPPAPKKPAPKKGKKVATPESSEESSESEEPKKGKGKPAPKKSKVAALESSEESSESEEEPMPKKKASKKVATPESSEESESEKGKKGKKSKKAATPESSEEESVEEYVPKVKKPKTLPKGYDKAKHQKLIKAIGAAIKKDKMACVNMETCRVVTKTDANKKKFVFLNAQHVCVEKAKTPMITWAKENL